MDPSSAHQLSKDHREKVAKPYTNTKDFVDLLKANLAIARTIAPSVIIYPDFKELLELAVLDPYCASLLIDKNRHIALQIKTFEELLRITQSADQFVSSLIKKYSLHIVSRIKSIGEFFTIAGANEDIAALLIEHHSRYIVEFFDTKTYDELRKNRSHYAALKLAEKEPKKIFAFYKNKDSFRTLCKEHPSIAQALVQEHGKDIIALFENANDLNKFFSAPQNVFYSLVEHHSDALIKRYRAKDFNELVKICPFGIEALIAKSQDALSKMYRRLQDYEELQQISSTLAAKITIKRQAMNLSFEDLSSLLQIQKPDLKYETLYDLSQEQMQEFYAWINAQKQSDEELRIPSQFAFTAQLKASLDDEHDFLDKQLRVLTNVTKFKTNLDAAYDFLNEELRIPLQLAYATKFKANLDAVYDFVCAINNFSEWINGDSKKMNKKKFPSFLLNHIPLIEDFLGEAILRLDLSNQNLSEVPGNILNLKSLQIVELQHNQIKELPEEIGHLPHLTHLLVADNCLKALPESCLKPSFQPFYDHDKQFYEFFSKRNLKNSQEIIKKYLENNQSLLQPTILLENSLKGCAKNTKSAFKS